MRIVPILALLAVATGASAQSLEDRAADVRRAIEPPPPVETVIDRGSRVVQPPPAAPQSSPAARPAEATPAGQVTVPVSTEVNERMNQLLTRSTPGLRVDQTGSGGAGFASDPAAATTPSTTPTPGSVGLREFPPGVLVIRNPNGGQGTGVSNLVTGGGTAPSAAP